MVIIRFDPKPCPEALARARTLLEVPVRHLGRDADGADCAGIARLQLSGRTDFPLPASYPLHWFERTPDLVLRCIASLGWPRARGVVRAWDVCVLRLFTSCGDHPGVYLGGGLLLHAYDLRVRISPLSELCRRRSWRDRLAAAFRPPETAACPQPSRSSPVPPSGPARPSSAPPSPAPP